MLLSAAAAKPLRSREEIYAAVDALTDAEWARLGRVGRRYGPRCDWDPDDLVQEAIARALDGSRNCPVHVTFVKCLAEAVRGIAYDERVKKKNTARHVPIVAPGDEVAGVQDVADERLNAEDRAVDAASVEEIRAAVLALFKDDSLAHDLADGVIADMSKAELCEMLGIDEKTHDTKRRLIRRRVDAKFPKGWKR